MGDIHGLFRSITLVAFSTARKKAVFSLPYTNCPRKACLTRVGSRIRFVRFIFLPRCRLSSHSSRLPSTTLLRRMPLFPCYSDRRPLQARLTVIKFFSKPSRGRIQLIAAYFYILPPFYGSYSFFLLHTNHMECLTFTSSWSRRMSQSYTFSRALHVEHPFCMAVYFDRGQPNGT